MASFPALAAPVTLLPPRTRPQYLLPRWTMGAPFLLQCKLGVWCYVLFKPFASLATIISFALGTYGDSLFTFSTAYV